MNSRYQKNFNEKKNSYIFDKISLTNYKHFNFEK